VKMKLPIIISEPGDVFVFDSVDKTMAYIEPPDVFDNLYTAYDSEGRLLNLKAVSRNYENAITIEVAEDTPAHQMELRNLLVDFLTRSRQRNISKHWLEQASLEQLILECANPRDS
jgi:hypothetical protein